MNESPWQPPADGQPEAEQPSLPPRPSNDSPSAPSSPSDPSPWSPEGSDAWTRPPEPAWSAPSSDVAPPPAEPWSRPAVDATVAADAPPNPSAVDAAPPSLPEPPRRRSKAVVAGAAVAVGALGIAGLFAVQRLSGGAAGGADSPDQLGTDLLAAVEAEDVLGVIDTLLPGEREALGDPFVELVGELQRLDVLSSETDLSRLLGIDVEFENESVQVLGTNVADIVNIGLAADATVTLDGATLPIGDFVESQLDQADLTELRGTRLTETDQFDLELTAVQDDGRWYFSLFHTIAEAARADLDAGAIPDVGVAADGADSPEAAVDRLLDRVEQLDLRGLIATLDPSEASALQRYAPLFLDDAEAALSEIPLDWRVDVREFRVEGDGDERTVFVDALGISGTLDGGEFTVRLSGDCITAEMDGESIEQCGGGTGDPDLDAILGDAPAIEAFTGAIEEAFADMEPFGLELRRRDGAWYVSPLATVTDALLGGLRALDRTELDTLVDAAEPAIDEFFDLFFGFGLGGLGGDVAPDEDWATDEFADDPIVIDEPIVGSDDGFGGESGETDPWALCYQEERAAEAAACFEAGVAAGDIDEFAVPASLLHPECGMAELQWEGGMYTLSDEEFAAVLDVAVPCFADLLARGEIEEWDVPFEATHADCFERRNWYNVFDDDAYNERVAACLDGGSGE